MATVGNERKFYITDSTHAAYTWLEGEKSNSFNRSASTVEVSDKETSWAKFLSGKKSATAEVTVNLDYTSTSEQHKLLKAFSEGSSVYCFVGVLGTGSTPTEGDLFEAIITGINDSSDEDSVVSRTISLQVTGAPTHTPSL